MTEPNVMWIREQCTNCGDCEPVCPNQAIAIGPKHYVVIPELCNLCVGFHEQPRCQEVCPEQVCEVIPRV